MALFLI